MNKKSIIIIPFALVIDNNLSPTAKTIYAVLKTFQKGKLKPGSVSSVTVTHAEIIQRSNLSKITVVKALNSLEANGWIALQRNIGSANRYIFTVKQ